MSPGDGADRKATPEQMTQHGKNLHRNVNEYLQLAWNNLQGARGITQSNFTATSYVLSMAYTAALDVAEEDLETKKKVLNKFRDLLAVSATNWESAEVKSTLSRP
ncbi:Uncharacterised protein [Mycobacterium tuberculosis]|jgi:hypothetical protein|nr:Uncharacterised protein [Mycobacterium tuberculosis]